VIIVYTSYPNPVSSINNLNGKTHSIANKEGTMSRYVKPGKQTS
jgi:hypothetical protein